MTPSPREQQALAFIQKYIEERDFPPYQREIAEHFGTRSRGFVCRLIDNMARKGLIERKYGVIGSIKPRKI